MNIEGHEYLENKKNVQNFSLPGPLCFVIKSSVIWLSLGISE